MRLQLNNIFWLTLNQIEYYIGIYTKKHKSSMFLSINNDYVISMFQHLRAFARCTFNLNIIRTQLKLLQVKTSQIMRSSHNPGQKKSLLKLFQQLTALHFTRDNNLLKFMNNNLLLLYTKIYMNVYQLSKFTTLLTTASIIIPQAVGGQLRNILSSQYVFICHLSY